MLIQSELLCNIKIHLSPVHKVSCKGIVLNAKLMQRSKVVFHYLEK